MKTIITILILFNSISPLPAQPVAGSSQKGDWSMIGETHADPRRENGSILLTNPGNFSALKLKAVNSPLNITGLELYYGTGEIEVIQLLTDLKAGGETRQIPLKGSMKELKKVIFIYKPLPKRTDNVQVQLFGIK